MGEQSPTSDEASIRHFTELLALSGKCSLLLVGLIALIMFYPFLNEARLFDRLLIGVLNSFILAAGAAAASRRRGTWILALALAAPTLILLWVSSFHDDRAVELSGLITIVIFYVFTIANVLAYVLGPGPVTGDKIHGAIAAYILTGLMWASIYLLVDRLVPGSFFIAGVSDNTTPMTWEHLVFFSFTTLTSTGYGWFVPSSQHAQSLAILEQLAGMFYVAILIARLAGLYNPPARQGKTEGAWRLRSLRKAPPRDRTP